MRRQKRTIILPQRSVILAPAQAAIKKPRA